MIDTTATATAPAELRCACGKQITDGSTGRVYESEQDGVCIACNPVAPSADTIARRAATRPATAEQMTRVGRLIAERDKSHLVVFAGMLYLALDVLDGKPISSADADALAAALERCPVLTPVTPQYDEDDECRGCGAHTADPCDPTCRYA